MTPAQIRGQEVVEADYGGVIVGTLDTNGLYRQGN
jgi:hypothetical protein